MFYDFLSLKSKIFAETSDVLKKTHVENQIKKMFAMISVIFPPPKKTTFLTQEFATSWVAGPFGSCVRACPGSRPQTAEESRRRCDVLDVDPGGKKPMALLCCVFEHVFERRIRDFWLLWEFFQHSSCFGAEFSWFLKCVEYTNPWDDTRRCIGKNPAFQKRDAPWW